MSLQSFTKQLQRQFNYSFPCEVDNEGRYCLSFGEKREMLIAESGKEALFFFSLVGICPQKNSEETLLRLMSANLFGEGTGGAVFGVDEKERMITLSCLNWHIHTAQLFSKEIENFLNVIGFWRHELEIDPAEWKPVTFFPSSITSLDDLMTS